MSAAVELQHRSARRNPPPLKWSDLRYVFDIKEDWAWEAAKERVAQTPIDDAAWQRELEWRQKIGERFREWKEKRSLSKAMPERASRSKLFALTQSASQPALLP